MVIGGLSDAVTNEPTSRVEMLDPRYVEVGSSCDEVSGVLAVTDVPDMRIGRYQASAVYMPNGSVLVAGGLDSSANPVSQLETFVPDE